MDCKLLQGDALTVLKTLPSESIDCVVTSPPYWALRDYNVEGQLGLEPTFQDYITKLCDIFDEVKRVLKKEGTCWVNMGDTYGTGSGSGLRTSKVQNRDTVLNETWQKEGKKEVDGFSKCLLQIPSRFAIEMTNRGWILRNRLIWHKPNCMPSSIKDRFTVDYEDIFFFVRSKKYYFETQYEPHKSSAKEINRQWSGGTKETQYATNKAWSGGVGYGANGRNKRSVWTIPTHPFPEAHFATYPEALIETPIKAGCPQYICKKCGKAREKIIENGELILGSHKRAAIGKYEICNNEIAGKMAYREKNPVIPNAYYEKINKGYTDCGCNAGFEGGVVLDPFFGAGTTGVTALRLKRQFVGIELNQKYIEISKQRLKPFLEQRLL